MNTTDSSYFPLVAPAGPSGDSAAVQPEDPDDLELEKMGYSQELMRGFNGFMAFSFCLTAVAVISSISIGFEYGLTTGGPSVALYGWLLGSFGTICVGLSMAEICSIYPSAGSVYHWAGQLVSPAHSPLCSYITGWFNFIGNAAGDAAFASGFSVIFSAAWAIFHDEQLSTELQVLIAILVTLCWSVQNALRVDQLGWLNNAASYYQVISTFVVFITLFASCSSGLTSGSVSTVFASTYNGTGFDSLVYVAFIGILFPQFSFSGYEAGAHMAEETKGASKSAPWGIVWTVIISAVIGFLYILALLFSVAENFQDFMAELALSDQNATVAAFQRCMSGNGGAFALTFLILLNLYLAGMSSLTVTSRITFAMARDGAFPGSNWLKAVHVGTKTPLHSVFLVFIVDSLLLMMPLISQTAFAAILSIATIGFQISYGIPILARITVGKKDFPLNGDFSLGRSAIILGWISSFWLFFTSFLMFLPQQWPISIENMNWTILVFAIFSLIGAIYWIFYARAFFVGPKRVAETEQKLLKENHHS